MPNDYLNATFDEITAERERLFGLGGIELCEVHSFTGRIGRGAGRMMPIDQTDMEAALRAARYNVLAALHAELEASLRVTPPAARSTVRPAG
jgi:cytolysin (calcineurin-like family phosphatase)